MKKTVNIAMIGVGCISGIYLKNITELFMTSVSWVCAI